MIGERKIERRGRRERKIERGGIGARNIEKKKGDRGEEERVRQKKVKDSERVEQR